MEIIELNNLINLFLLSLVAIVLVLAGIKKQPGLGIIIAIVIIALQLVSQRRTLSEIGFYSPGNWAHTLILGMGLGIFIQLMAVIFIEPLTEKITGEKHDHSILNDVRGNWKLFMQWMIMVWLLVAILEEGIFRGYFITELTSIFGSGLFAFVLIVIFSSVVFGFSHGYQNKCGILSTGIVGIILGIIYIRSDFNLWLVIITHGFIHTVGIGLIAAGYDQKMKLKF